MRWNFRSTFIEKQHDGRALALDILYYNCRFKRSVAPVSFELVDDGSHRVIEKARWSELRQETSGPVLSKMIRKGINNPAELGDIIGAMFIVNDNDALGDLLQLLDSCIGTPFGWRNVTDTLSGADVPGSELNSWSSRAYKVFKGDIDVLVQPEGVDRPYRFPVEVQIYTLEAYLRTVCGQHEASHQALKQRQFLYGLAPRLFPRRVYGGALAGAVASPASGRPSGSDRLGDQIGLGEVHRHGQRFDQLAQRPHLVLERVGITARFPFQLDAAVLEVAADEFAVVDAVDRSVRRC